MYKFPPPYSSFYQNTINKPKLNNKVDNKKNNSNDSIKSFPKADSDNNCINVLGINLYLDDLIILFIIFILYKEKIKDNELIICLFLLLLN